MRWYMTLIQMIQVYATEAVHLLSSLCLQFLQVEVEFFTFKNVPITTTTLTWTRRNTSKNTTTRELFFQMLVNLCSWFSCIDLPLQMIGPWFVQRIVFHLSNFVTLLTSQGLTIMTFIPLFEGCSIDLDNSIFHQGLGSDQLVVTCVVHYIKNSPC